MTSEEKRVRLKEIEEYLLNWSEEKAAIYGPDWSPTTTFYMNQSFLISELKAAWEREEFWRKCCGEKLNETHSR